MLRAPGCSPVDSPLHSASRCATVYGSFDGVFECEALLYDFFELHLYSRLISAFIVLLTETLLHFDGPLCVTLVCKQVCRWTYRIGLWNLLW